MRILSALAKSGTYCETGSLNFSLPLSTSCRTAIAVNDLVTEASRKTVADVMGVPFSTSAKPKPLTRRAFPSRTTATAAPGDLLLEMFAKSWSTAFALSGTAARHRVQCAASTAATQQARIILGIYLLDLPDR